MPDNRVKQTAPKRHEEFAGQIIAMLEKGLAPWQRDWQAGTLYPPLNPVSGTVYSGINRVMLSKPDYADPRWMTFKQAGGAGYRVRKGAKSQPIVHWQWMKTVDRLDEDGQPVLDAEGRPEQESVRLERPLVRFFSVFHASQLETEDGLAIPPFEAKEMGWRPHERAEALLEASGANIIHDQRDRAFYRLKTDEIHLPPKENFSDEGRYYPTALHELGHWTRHPSRLDRGNGPFGSEMYAREELIAHIASWMLSQDLGIAFNADHQAAYLQSWLKALKDDPHEIFRACSDAERVRQYILGLEQKLEHEAVEAGTVLENTVNDSPKAGTGKWYDGLRRPEGFSYLYGQWRGLGPGAVSEAKDGLRQVYSNYTRRISETVADAPEDPGTLERRRERLANLLLETNMLHGKMIELGLLPPDARFQHQELAERILERERPANVAREKVYLAVAYKDKNAAKKAEARWDGGKKLWYAPVGADLNGLAVFIPEKEPLPTPAVSPVEEFRRLLENEGFILKGDPVMDGKIHRAAVEGKPGQRDGAYQAYADGLPNGWFQNHRTGDAQKWIYSGQQLSAEQKKAMQADMDRRREAAAKALEEQYAKAAERVWAKFAACAGTPADPDHSYLKAKGVADYGLCQDREGNLLVFGVNLDRCEFPGRPRPGSGRHPSLNDLVVTNQLQTVQTISPGGEKRFEPGSRKKGAVCLIGEEHFKKIAYDQARKEPSLFDDLSGKPEILLAEGHATAASLYRATGLPVAAAFDAGNLPPAAEALRRKFPEAAITVCADNDHPLVWKAISKDLGDIEITPDLEEQYAGHNKGLVKAMEAAKAVDGKVIFPQFTEEERAKGLTDFNDLAQSRGVFAVTEQVSLWRRSQAAAQSLSL